MVQGSPAPSGVIYLILVVSAVHQEETKAPLQQVYSVQFVWGN